MAKKSQTLRSVDQPFYRYWQALYLAFFSKTFYVDVAKRWRGCGFIYFFILIAIAVIPLSVRITLDFNYYINAQYFLPFQKMPILTIKNGEASFDGSMPYFIKNDAQAVIAIIDTTGEITGIRKEYPNLAVLVMKDHIYFRPPPMHLFLKLSTNENPPIYDKAWREFNDGQFDGNVWANSSEISLLKWSILLLIYPIIVLFIYGFFLTLMMIFALIGKAYALIIFKFKIPYTLACRLALVAATPLIFILFSLLALNRGIYGAGLTSLILFSFYFSYALLVVRRESKKMVLL